MISDEKLFNLRLFAESAEALGTTITLSPGDLSELVRDRDAWKATESLGERQYGELHDSLINAQIERDELLKYAQDYFHRHGCPYCGEGVEQSSRELTFEDWANHAGRACMRGDDAE